MRATGRRMTMSFGGLDAISTTAPEIRTPVTPGPTVRIPLSMRDHGVGMLRLRDGQATLWEELLPRELRLLSPELAAVARRAPVPPRRHGQRCAACRRRPHRRRLPPGVELLHQTTHLKMHRP